MSVPPLVVCAAAALLYALGGRGRVGARGPRRLREASFYLGIVVLGVALEPPFDEWADTSFALHMAQHVLLLTVVPPLVVLGRPWPRMWLPFPAGARRSALQGLARGGWSAPLRLAGRVLTRPPVAVAALAATLAVWHVPALYAAAVDSEWVHFLEHACFLAASLLLWAPLLDAPPVRARIDNLRRAGWFVAAAVPGWILAIVLAYASKPIYPVYADLPHRAFGLSAGGDQAVAAGVMWVPGSLAYLVAFIVFVYRWLEPEAPSPRPGSRPEELSWT
ncbi:MAG TPA: cytochrome c oxidase assembly protein [Gaiellaceae bacterium]|nr:cytochrome c oxidase assembly protein [Gaiellaceae bacterium]